MLEIIIFKLIVSSKEYSCGKKEAHTYNRRLCRIYSGTPPSEDAKSVRNIT